MGSHHVRAYAALPGRCRLAGVYDPDAGRAGALAARWGARAYETADALLADVDAVSIASPTHAHVADAAAALRRGCHALVEKPAAASVEAVRHLCAVADATGRRQVLQVGHIEHFNPAVRELRRALAGEELLAVQAQRLSSWDGRSGDIDVVQDLMLHDIHVLLSLTGAPVRSVQAGGRAVHAPGRIDFATAIVTFEDGLVATLTASRVTEEKVRRLAATTARGLYNVDYVHRTLQASRCTSIVADAAGSPTTRLEGIVERVFVPIEEPLVVQLGAFLDAIEEGREADVGIDDALRCMELVEAVRAGVAAEAAAGALAA
jgi:predicted dehydrogenase